MPLPSGGRNQNSTYAPAEAPASRTSFFPWAGPPSWWRTAHRPPSATSSSRRTTGCGSRRSRSPAAPQPSSTGEACPSNRVLLQSLLFINACFRQQPQHKLGTQGTWLLQHLDQQHVHQQDAVPHARHLRHRGRPVRLEAALWALASFLRLSRSYFRFVQHSRSCICCTCCALGCASCWAALTPESPFIPQGHSQQQQIHEQPGDWTARPAMQLGRAVSWA